MTDRAQTFHQLHAAPALVLPNAWDAASTRIAVQAGAAAVATSSAAVAWSLGCPDGNVLTRDLLLDSLSRVVAAAGNTPVSADIEAGFGTTPDEIAETVRLVIEAGAVGINIEDWTADGPRSIDEQSAVLAAVRQAADATGVPLYLNARTDTYLAGDGNFGDTIARAAAYLAAGASGIFVPGVGDPDLVSRLVAAIPAPLNILVGPGSPTVPELAAIGVRRISAGSSIAQAIHGHTRRAVTELLGPGTYAELDGGITHPQMNEVLTR